MVPRPADAFVMQMHWPWWWEMHSSRMHLSSPCVWRTLFPKVSRDNGQNDIADILGQKRHMVVSCTPSRFSFSLCS